MNGNMNRYTKILKLAIILEVIDSIFQKIVEIDIVDSQPIPCTSYIRAYKYNIHEGETRDF